MSFPPPAFPQLPEVVYFYNKNKCGVDIIVQLIRFTQLKQGVASMVTRCLVQYAGINAWIMFKKCTGSQLYRKSFLFQLIEELISCGQGVSSSNRLLPTQPCNILAEPRI